MFPTLHSWMLLVVIGFQVTGAGASNLVIGPPQKESDAHAGEGPVWHPDGFLYFSGNNRITRRDADGTIRIFREPSGGSNGLLLDFEGRLIACEAAHRRVTRTETDGGITVLADSFRGKRFNTPNDLCIDSKGRIYFTDPRYGPRTGMEMLDENGREIEGVYRIDAPGQVVRIIGHEVDRPNGILVTPDDKHLYVADNNNDTIGGARKLWRFDLYASGDIVPNSRTQVFDWETARGPDGLEMDEQGRLYVAAGLNRANPPFESTDKFKGGIYILSPEGKLLEFVPIPTDEVTNCTFGGPELTTLYITAGGELWSVGVTTRGRPVEAAPRFDLVIRNGKVVDGTGNPWFYGDLGIRADRIARIGRIPAGSARREIDARNLAVAPGFIDMHSHSDWLLLEDGNAQSKIRQGVTTEVLGEGSSVAPFAGKIEPRSVKAGNSSVRIATLNDYFSAIERAGVSLNVLTYVGLDNLWRSVMGHSFDRPEPAQIEEMKRLLAAAMKEGAFGLSTMLMMPPGSLATTEDLIEFARVVREHEGIFSSHIRTEGIGVFESIKEIISVGERAGVPVDIIHLKIADQKYWGRMPEIVAIFEEARSRGVQVQANVYPYTRGNNDLASVIPPWAHEGGAAQMLARLKDPQLRSRLKHDIQNGVSGWYNHFTAVGGDWSRMLVSANNPFKGLTMDQVISKWRQEVAPTADPLDILFDLLIQQNGSVSTVYAHHTEEDMTLALSQPWCSVGSDGSAYATEGPLRRGNPHPRNFGTFPRVLGVYVRERGLLRWEDAIRKMTSLNASKLGLRDRGLLREGMFADITVLDPARVIDRSTFTDPFHYNEGIDYVIVNGQVVLDRGQHTGARPGRALRHR